MNAILKIWKAEPVLVVTVLGIIVNTVAQIVAGTADWSTAVQGALLAIGGVIARTRVAPT